MTARTGNALWLREGLVLVALGLAFVPLTPRFPDQTVATNEPPYVADGELASDTAGSTLLTYPYVEFPFNGPMLWQATSKMSFSLLGEYAIITKPNGQVSSAPPVLPPAAMQTLFARALNGGKSSATGHPPPLTPELEAKLREFLKRYGVGTIVVQPVGYDPDAVVTDLTGALGVPPSTKANVFVWPGSGSSVISKNTEIVMKT